MRLQPFSFSFLWLGGTPNTGSLALLDRKTGVPPVREDSASRLSADEPTGGTPVLLLTEAGFGGGNDLGEHATVGRGTAGLVGFATAFAAGEGNQIAQHIAGLEPAC